MINIWGGAMELDDSPNSNEACLSPQLLQHSQLYWVSRNILCIMTWRPPVTGWPASPCQLELIERRHDIAARVTASPCIVWPFSSVHFKITFLHSLPLSAWANWEVAWHPCPCHRSPPPTAVQEQHSWLFSTVRFQMTPVPLSLTEALLQEVHSSHWKLVKSQG